MLTCAWRTRSQRISGIRADRWHVRGRVHRVTVVVWIRLAIRTCGSDHPNQGAGPRAGDNLVKPGLKGCLSGSLTGINHQSVLFNQHRFVRSPPGIDVFRNPSSAERDRGFGRGVRRVQMTGPEIDSGYAQEPLTVNAERPVVERMAESEGAPEIAFITYADQMIRIEAPDK